MTVPAPSPRVADRTLVTEMSHLDSSSQSWAEQSPDFRNRVSSNVRHPPEVQDRIDSGVGGEEEGRGSVLVVKQCVPQEEIKENYILGKGRVSADDESSN